MDRDLVQVKQRRSSSDATCWIVQKPVQLSACIVSGYCQPGSERPWRAGNGNARAGYVGHTPYAGQPQRGHSVLLGTGDSADPIAGPMKLIRVRGDVAAADGLRNRLCGRPFINRPAL